MDEKEQKQILKDFTTNILNNSKSWEDSILELFDGDVEKASAFMKKFNDNFWDFLL